MILRLACLLAALLAPASVRASFLTGETLDTVSNWMSWFVIVLVPIVAITAILFVHVLPEKIAERRHHPHKDSIKVLCILSLFFGGMLWPIAWLWAYTKPLGYQMIYGTDKHEDYFLEKAQELHEGTLTAEEASQLRAELAAMEAKAPLRPELQLLADRLDTLPVVVKPTAPLAPPSIVTRSARPTEVATGGGE
jgi:CBS domain containing-hemolysin-like protein